MIRPFSETIDSGKDLTMMKEPKASFQILKENRIPLTSEERKIVMKRKAVWHHGPHGEETPAVWKSKDSHGNIIYVTATHRAWNSSKTLLGCINRYHKFIKSTASEDL